METVCSLNYFIRYPYCLAVINFLRNVTKEITYKFIYNEGT